MGVGETGVGEMGVGKTGVGEQVPIPPCYTSLPRLLCFQFFHHLHYLGKHVTT